MILEWFVFAFNAVAPILLLVLLGYLLRRKGLFTPEFLRIANRFCFCYCIPTLLFMNIYTMKSLAAIPWKTALFIVAALTLLTGLGLVAGHTFTDKHNRRGVIAQCWMRSNSAIIGLPLATAVGGEAAAMVLSPLQAPAITMYNAISVVLLTIFSEDSEKKIDWKCILLSIPQNPLIRGLFVGLVVLFVRGFIPLGADGIPVFTIQYNLPAVYSALNSVSRIATPLALVVLGGQFNFSAVGGMRKEIIAGVIGRLVVAPVVGFGLAWAASKAGLFEITPALVASFIAIFASPVSVSSAPMATEMKADDVLAGQLVVWTCIFSMFTLFILIVVFRAIGWL